MNRLNIAFGRGKDLQKMGKKLLDIPLSYTHRLRLSISQGHFSERSKLWRSLMCGSIGLGSIIGIHWKISLEERHCSIEFHEIKKGLHFDRPDVPTLRFHCFVVGVDACEYIFLLDINI